MTKTTDLNQAGLGQLFMCGFDGLEPTQGILDLIQHYELGSVILFSRNIASPSQVQNLTYTLQRAAKEAGHARPLLIAVDQENGVVRRLGKSGTYLPGNMALGAINSSSTAYQVAKATAKELLSLGINWNLAPVMDVNNNAMNPVIGVRSFGEDPERVSKLCMAQVDGYHGQGVMTSLKHFPGHGDTETDSHLGLPVIDKSMKELEQIELVPYRKILEKKDGNDGYPSSIMVGHIVLPKLMKKNKNQPASLASEIVNDLLREKLGYQGVVITDCVEMDAIKDTVGCAQGAIMALQAGNDISMISHTLAFQQEAFELLGQAVASGELNPTSLKLSLDRISQLKDRFLSWEDVLKMKDLDVIGCKEHLELSDRLYNRVPSLIRDQKKMIPIQVKAEDKVLFLAAHVPLTLAIDSEKEPFDSMYQALVQRHRNTKYVIFNEDTQPISNNVLKEFDYIVVGTANANLYPFQAKLVKSLLVDEQAVEKLIVVAVINPYDLMVFPEVGTYFVTYEYTPPAHEAFVRMLFGEIETDQNDVPVTIIPNMMICNKKRYKVQEFKSNQMNDCYQLWKRVYQDRWPISINDFELIVSKMKNGHHLIVSDDYGGGGGGGKIVGFAVTQIVERTGQLALLIVDPEYQGKGIGTALNDGCLEWFRKEGIIEKIMVGSTYPRFFCGVPNHDEMGQRAQVFFKNRGYEIEEKVVWDMMGDLTDYKIPKEIEERMKKENIWFGQIKKEEMKELYEFQHKYFNYWVSTYQHHAELGDYHDLIVAREGGGGKDKKIIASVILYTSKGSHSNRTDLVWTDSSLFGSESGGMACVGVASEERKRGIGIGIVSFANKILCERGVKKSYVDWVELVDFYRRTGYQTWRDYKLAAMN